jgi:two-component system cell cycle sensor histidine kinase/response regulator CckA
VSHSPNINGQSFRIDHSHVRARVGATIAVFAIAFVLVIYAQYASSRQADLIRMLGLFLGCFALIPLVHSVTETWFQSRVFRNISVRDQGCGIPADKLSKIFEPFYTTKRIGEGTGLGLSTAYGIVKQTGGYIFVDSILGQGTEFTLIFPAIDADPITQAPIVEVTPKAKVNHGCGVILLVEDEAPVRTFASRALKLRGHQVIEACSAEEVLEKLRDQSLRVDVFVTDIVMPGRDGPSWVKEALVERPNTRVVFVSGYAEDVLETQQASVPNSVFLPKPFSLDALTQTVQQQMH